MRKFLITLATLAGVFSASYFAFSTPAPLITGTSGCQEASQLLNCLNSAVINLLRGTGPTGNALTAPLSVGTVGTVTAANGNTNQTLNTQGGQFTITALNLVANSAGVVNTFNNSLMTTSSLCTAVIGTSNATAGSAPYIAAVVPGAGNLGFNLANGSAVAASNFNVSVNYWCYF